MHWELIAYVKLMIHVRLVQDLYLEQALELTYLNMLCCVGTLQVKKAQLNM